MDCRKSLSALCLLSVLSFSPDAASAAPMTTSSMRHTATRAERVLTAFPVEEDVLAQRIELTQPRAEPGFLVCSEKGNPRERHRLSIAPATSQKLQLHGLKSQTHYTCQLQDHNRQTIPGVETQFTTGVLPRNIIPPKITVPSSNLPATGYTIYNYGYVKDVAKLNWPSENFLVIVDAEGNIRWYYQGPGAGDVDASYLGGEQLIFGGRSGQTYPPTIINISKKTLFTATNQVGSPYELEGKYLHDAGVSVDKQSIFTLAQTVSPGGWRGFVIKQIDLQDNLVIWSWDSYDDGVLSGALDTGGATSGQDPFHPNAVYDTIENGRVYLYLSLWKTSQIFKIDYATGQVVWTLGLGEDFTLLEANGTPAAASRWFFNQHDAKRIGNLIYLHDNGTERVEHGGQDYSRALVLELNESQHTARIVSEYAETNWAEPVWGGHDLLPSGNGLIAMGHCYEEDEDYYSMCAGHQTNSHHSGIVEYDANKKVVWRADFTTLNEAIYRAEHIDGCALFANTTYCPALQ